MNKTFYLGSIVGIRIEMHILLPIVAIFWNLDNLAMIPVFLIVVFGSVLLHELGHALAAKRVGGDARRIILWPLGGLAECSVPENPRAHFITAVAGPLVSLALGVTSFLMVQFMFPARISGSLSIVEIMIISVMYMNAMLFLFNLIPAYPMDGGRIIRSILWPLIGYAKAAQVAFKLAMICSIGMGIWAVHTGHLMLLLIAAYIFFQARQERKLLEMINYNPGFMASTHLQTFGPATGQDRAVREPVWREKKPGFFEQRKALKEQKRADQKQADEARIRKQVDALLDKINQHGMMSLTDKERRFLEEASKRFKDGFQGK